MARMWKIPTSSWKNRLLVESVQRGASVRVLFTGIETVQRSMLHGVISRIHLFLLCVLFSLFALLLFLSIRVDLLRKSP